jgi:hypothetical protein
VAAPVTPTSTATPQFHPSSPAAEPQRFRPAPAPAAAPRRTVVFEDDLDVPDFMK